MWTEAAARWWWTAVAAIMTAASAGTMIMDTMRAVLVVAARPVAQWRTAAVAGERMAAGANGDPHELFKMNRTDKNMKFSNQLTRCSHLSIIALWACVCSIVPASLQAADPKDSPKKPAAAQQCFASSDEAIKALQAATECKDSAALCAIFGPEFHELSTGDKVQDGNNAKRFAAAIAQSCNPVKEGEDKITLELGTNEWPMPIPLVKTNGQWRFDT
jgi:hypothetical protein